MFPPKLQPVQSIDNLRERVDRLLRSSPSTVADPDQLALTFQNPLRSEGRFQTPTDSVSGFLDFLSDALPDGDVYLFGGVLRDLALLGRRGFSSDIDLVVEGDWDHCEKYVVSLGAIKNKFGGYRLDIAGWPVDIWNARETWAIQQGLVSYAGISSLTETTVLNWDAILMNWRTRQFVHPSNYLDSIRARVLDVVLADNPNPLGMAVRVFRHLCLKDARSVTASAANYLASCTVRYAYEELRTAEIRSYGDSVVSHNIYRLFEHLGTFDDQVPLQSRYLGATDLLSRELGFP